MFCFSQPSGTMDCRFLAKFPYSGKAGGALSASFYVYWTSKNMTSYCSPFNVLRT
jgi:hypothetical protein